MRKRAAYPAPPYHDPNDRRLVQIIRQARKPMGRAVNIIGVPYDGAVLGRKGAAGGPGAIRGSMVSFSNYNLELGQGLEGARIFDLGDVVLGGGGVKAVHQRIETELAGALSTSSLLVVLGGDNSVSLPSLRACARRFGSMGLVVIDSHLDLRGEIEGKPTSGSSYGLALEEGLVEPERTVEIGVHGFLNSKKYFERARALGVEVFTAEDVRKKGAAAIAKASLARALRGKGAVYLSIDLDAVDLGQVTGVSAPSVGGISAFDLCVLACEISRHSRVKASDIVELAPNLDPTGRSQRVAATALAYVIAGFAAR